MAVDSQCLTAGPLASVTPRRYDGAVSDTSMDGSASNNSKADVIKAWRRISDRPWDQGPSLAKCMTSPRLGAQQPAPSPTLQPTDSAPAADPETLLISDSDWRPWSQFGALTGWTAHTTKRAFMCGGSRSCGQASGYLLYRARRRYYSSMAMRLSRIASLHFLFEQPADYAHALHQWQAKGERHFAPVNFDWEFRILSTQRGRWDHQVVLVRRVPRAPAAGHGSPAEDSTNPKPHQQQHAHTPTHQEGSNGLESCALALLEHLGRQAKWARIEWQAFGAWVEERIKGSGGGVSTDGSCAASSAGRPGRRVSSP